MKKRTTITVLLGVVVALILIVAAPNQTVADEGPTLTSKAFEAVLANEVKFPRFPGVNAWTRAPGQRLNVAHIQYCASWWQQPASERPACDADQSGGVITLFDVFAVAAYWGAEWDTNLWFNVTGLEELDTEFNIDDIRWLVNQLLLQENRRNLRGDVGRRDEKSEPVIGHDNVVDIVDLVVMLDNLPTKVRGTAFEKLPEPLRREVEKFENATK